MRAPPASPPSPLWPPWRAPKPTAPPREALLTPDEILMFLFEMRAACGAVIEAIEPYSELAGRASADANDEPPGYPALPRGPRVREVLLSTLGGASEKQTAARLNLSVNTVHVYMKQLHAYYGVASRGELMSLFVHRAFREP